MSALAYQSATQQVAVLRSGEIGSLELLEYYLERVARHDGALNAIVVRDFERARERAVMIDRARARGEDVGALQGLPMTIKESFNVAGLPTCWGLEALKDTLAKENAVAVQRLLDAGAVIFGKTNVPVMLTAWQSYNPVYGTTNNPWDLNRSPGGSSGGSAAALAAGLTALEFGSDIAGSIRVPAHFCGLYGLKPTLNLIPGRGQTIDGSVGAFDLGVVGPLARHAEDLELALDLTAGPDLLQDAAWHVDLPKEDRRSLADFRVAVWLETEIAPTERSIGDGLQDVADRLADLGATVSNCARPAIAEREIYELYLNLLIPLTSEATSAEQIEDAKASVSSLDPQDQSFRARWLRGVTMTHQDWLSANERRQQMRYRWHEFFKDWDVLLCPVLAVPAYAHQHTEDREMRRIAVNGEPHRVADLFFWPGLISVVGLPAVAAPMGQTPDGLPMGLQIVAPEWHEKRAIRFARLLADEIGGFTPPPL